MDEEEQPLNQDGISLATFATLRRHDAYYRRNVMGMRTNFSARTVARPSSDMFNFEYISSPIARSIRIDLPQPFPRINCDSSNYCISCETVQVEKLIIEGALCSICLELFRITNELVCANHCNHIFHKTCLDEWLQQNETCPNCRTNLNRNNVFVNDGDETHII